MKYFNLCSLCCDRLQWPIRGLVTLCYSLGLVNFMRRWFLFVAARAFAQVGHPRNVFPRLLPQAGSFERWFQHLLYQSMLQGGEQTADYHRSLLKSAQACCMVSPYCCSLPQTCFQSVGLQCASSAHIRQGGRTWFTRLYSIISCLESFMRQAPPKDDDCVIVGRKCLEDAVGPLVG